MTWKGLNFSSYFSATSPKTIAMSRLCVIAYKVLTELKLIQMYFRGFRKIWSDITLTLHCSEK